MPRARVHPVSGTAAKLTPERAVPFRRDRPVRPRSRCGVGQLGGEVAGVRADPSAGAHRRGQPLQRPPQQVRAAWAHVLVPGQQVRRQRQAGLHPSQLPRAEPARQRPRRRRRRRRHRQQHRSAASARTRSNPASTSCPNSCAPANETSSCPPDRPRLPVLIGPIPASNADTTPSRSTSSDTASIPAAGANDGSDAPTRTRGRHPPPPSILFTERVPSHD